MEITIGIERLTALVLIVTGLSHIVAPRQWARFFIAMREQSPVPGFLNAYVHGPLGFLIIAFHWVWTWPGIVVTILGCGLALKGALYFIFPRLAERSLSRVSEGRAWEFAAAGVPALALGLFVGWMALGAPAIG